VLNRGGRGVYSPLDGFDRPAPPPDRAEEPVARYRVAESALVSRPSAP